jgi:ATP-binding cassette subfamily B protein
VSDSSNSRAAPTAAAASERAKSRELGHLRHLWPFVKPHGSVLVSALAALLVAAGATLAIGQALRRVIASRPTTLPFSISTSWPCSES